MVLCQYFPRYSLLPYFQAREGVLVLHLEQVELLPLGLQSLYWFCLESVDQMMGSLYLQWVHFDHLLLPSSMVCPSESAIIRHLCLVEQPVEVQGLVEEVALHPSLEEEEAVVVEEEASLVCKDSTTSLIEVLDAGEVKWICTAQKGKAEAETNG